MIAGAIFALVFLSFVAFAATVFFVGLIAAVVLRILDAIARTME